MNHLTTNVSTFDLREIEKELNHLNPHFLGGFVFPQKMGKIMVKRDYNYFHQLQHKILH